MKPDFIKELYFRELEEKHQQDSRTTLQVFLLSLLGGVLVFCVRHFRTQHPVLLWLFVACFGVASVFYALALIQVLRANFGHVYERLPDASALYRYFQELKVFYTKHPGVAGSAEADFDTDLQQRMVSATSRNSYANLLRAARHYSAVRFMALVVVFGILAAVPVLIALLNNQ